jgi:hypothetical protein
MENMEIIHKHEKVIRLFIVTTFSLLPLALFAVFMAFRIGQVAEERATVEADRLVRVIESQQEQVFRNIRNTLISLIQFVEVENEKLNTESCNNTFASLLSHMNRKEKMYNNLAITDQHGNILCSGSGDSTQINVSDRDYFQMALQKRDFVIGGYIVGRVLGEPTLPVAYPILDEAGEVKLVAIGTLNLEWINNFANRIKILEEGPILVVTGRYGTVIAQYPEGLAWVGKDFYPEEIQNKTEGNFKALWLDNLPYLFSYVRLPADAELGQDHLKFYLGIPLSQISNFITKEIINYFLVLISLIGIFGLTGWFISKKLAKQLTQ